MNSTKKRRLGYLSAYFLGACALVFFLKPQYIVSIAIVLIPPAAVNFAWLNRQNRYKVLIFSVLSALLFAPPIELIMRLGNVWDTQTAFPRPLGIIPLENLLFAFINFFWALGFYEYFVDKPDKKPLSKKFKYLILFYILLSVVIYTMYFFDQSLLKISYLAMAVPVLLVPALYIYLHNPHLLRKAILPTVFFGVAFFVYEVVSLYIGNWWWPGEYLYSFVIGGKILPMDDAFVWYLLSTPTLIGGYECFADDGE